MAESAKKICKRLHAYLKMDGYRGTVQSVFANAVNIVTPIGLVSVLSNAHCLHPYSMVIQSVKPFTQMGIQEGQEVLLADETLQIPACACSIDYRQATDLDLSIGVMQTLFIPIDLSIRTRHLYRVIEGCGSSDDLSPLVTEAKTNPYCDLIRPRLPALCDALNEQDILLCEQAAARLAGCGVGLTPSSDDLLTGYMSAYAALSMALGRSRDRVLPLTRAIASGASAHTTDLSAAFLLQSGEGLVSEDVFALLRSIFSDVSYPTMVAQATKVAAFGSTSGTDILTGMYLAIIHHYGGKNIE